MSEARPRLRYLEAFPVTQEGGTAILLRDPWQIAERAIVVAPELYALLAMLDGSRTVLDLQAELTRRTGRIVFREQVEGILDQLDDLHFLDNDRSRSEMDRAVREFRAQRIRQAVHAGNGYPASRDDLTAMLDSFYTHPEGAGLPGPPGRSGIRAIAAPHVDLRLGGTTYTHAYRRLAESAPAEVFVILGIGHMGLSRYFSVGRKDFQTPLGLSRYDREFVSSLDRFLGAGAFAEELNHRFEHTIEFQVVFLQHLYPDCDFTIVPILTSFCYADLDEPGCRADVERFTSALGRVVEESGRAVCLIASVDLAHLGPRYGDSAPPDQGAIAESAAADRYLLSPVIEGDAEEFLRRIRAEEDRRRICGFPALYAMLKVFPGLRGELLNHSYCRIDDEGGSIVSYASLAFPA